jgi:hypothetical protein
MKEQILNWAKNRLYKMRMAGGELLDKEEVNKRLKVCNSCEYKGQVKIPVPLLNITDEGCTKCGCPFVTKPYLKTYFDTDTMKFELTVCPHENGNKWDFSDKNVV